MRQKSSFKRHFGSGTEKKTITFRTATEAEMNHAVNNIKECVQNQGGMAKMSEQGYPLQVNAVQGVPKPKRAFVLSCFHVFFILVRETMLHARVWQSVDAFLRAEDIE